MSPLLLMQNMATIAEKTRRAPTIIPASDPLDKLLVELDPLELEDSTEDVGERVEEANTEDDGLNVGRVVGDRVVGCGVGDVEGREDLGCGVGRREDRALGLSVRGDRVGAKDVGWDVPPAQEAPEYGRKVG